MSLDTLDTTNLGFRMIQDTLYDTKVFEGLVKAGILPQQFQVLKCSVSTSDSAAGTVAVVDDHTGLPVVLAEGQQIVLLSGVVTETVTRAAGALTVTIGLDTVEAVAAGSISQALTAAVAKADLEIGEGFALTPSATYKPLVQTAPYLVAELSAATASADTGVIQLTLIVV